MEAIRNTLIKYFISNGVEGDVAAEADAQTNFLEAQWLDSLGIVELLGFLEDHFGVWLGPEELESREFQTIDGLASIIVSLQNGPNREAA